MADPFVAEIRVFAFNFAPRGWATCNGQLMPLSQNTALFSLLGTTYGGNGKSNFALPNMQGNVPMHWKQGPGLSEYSLGETGGVPNVTLLQTEMPAHNHAVTVSQADAISINPGDQLCATCVGGLNAYSTTLTPPVQLSPLALPPMGGSLPHNNMQPYLSLNFCIALQGVFPPRG